jgi:hypothetical protein
MCVYVCVFLCMCLCFCVCVRVCIMCVYERRKYVKWHKVVGGFATALQSQTGQLQVSFVVGDDVGLRKGC